MIAKKKVIERNREGTWSPHSFLNPPLISNKILKDRVDKIARNCNYDGYQKTLASMVCNFCDKRAGSEEIETRKVGVSVNEQLA